jgi:integrase/recombinase XerD
MPRPGTNHRNHRKTKENPKLEQNKLSDGRISL